jgi:phenylacetate-CoA ligase
MSLTRAKRSLATRLAWSAHVARRAPFESRFPFRDPAAIERAQRRRLEATVAHAYEHVPYYRETMRRIGLGPGDVRAVGDLVRLPLIDREQVQGDPEYFLSRAEPLESYVELRTSGSTGDPLSLLYHPFSLFEQAVFTERRRSVISRLAGRRRYRDARVGGVPRSPAGGPNVKQAFRGLSLISPSLRVSQRQYADGTPLEELIPQFNQFRPHVISSFGSFHEMLFTHLLRSGERMHLPRVATYAGDGMTDSAREMIRREFGVEALSAYTASEAFLIGFECERHRGHHLNLDLFPVRIISEDGRDAPVGERGQVVVSNLQARGTVLLNYRLNDVAARLPDHCPCGRNLPLLSAVQGRTDEWLEDSTGRHLHSQVVRGSLNQELDVLRYQVVQESPSRFRAALVTAPGSDADAIARRLAQRFESAFGEGTELDLSFVGSLPRSAAGKARPVIPMTAHRQPEAPGVG